MTVTIPEAPSDQPILDALDTYAASWGARDDAAQQTIIEQQRTIDELRKPLPPAHQTLFGCSRPDAAGKLVDVVRTYLTLGQRPTSWQADGGLNRAHSSSNRAIIVSWKDAPGDWLGQLLTTSPDDRTIYACQNHEPFDNFGGAGQPTIRDYQQRWVGALGIIEAVGKPNIVPTTILDGSHPESWQLFTVDGVAVRGVDRYNPGIQKPSRYTPPAEVFGPWLDFTDGDPTLIAETGSGPAGGDMAGLLEWSAGAHVELAGAENVEAAAWWYQGTLQQPAAFAAFLSGVVA